MTESRERSHQHDRWTCAPNRLECVCHILCRSWKKNHRLSLIDYSTALEKPTYNIHNMLYPITQAVQCKCVYFHCCAHLKFMLVSASAQFSSHCWVKINLRFFKTVMTMGWEYFTSCSFFFVHFFCTISTWNISRRVKISVLKCNEGKGELKKRRREFSCVHWTCCVTMHFVGIIGRSGNTRISVKQWLLIRLGMETLIVVSQSVLCALQSSVRKSKLFRKKICETSGWATFISFQLAIS